jgi:cell division protein FtsQ
MIRILKILFWAGLITAVGIALVYAGQRHEETICTDFVLKIESRNSNPLVTAGEIEKRIVEATDSLIGKPVGKINLYDIHRVIQEIPYVERADILSDINGSIRIGIHLREPVVRVMSSGSNSFYIDTEGWLMPVNPGHPGRVLIGSGNLGQRITVAGHPRMHVDSLPERSMVRELFRMAKYINSSGFLRALIAQVHVEGHDDVRLIPVVGDYIIMFGGFDEAEEKFEKLTTYYREGAGKAGWVQYSTIDLRYQNQVICSKK